MHSCHTARRPLLLPKQTSRGEPHALLSGLLYELRMPHARHSFDSAIFDARRRTVQQAVRVRAG